MPAEDHVLEFVSASPRFAGRGESLFVKQPARAEQTPQLSVAKGSDGVCVFREDRRCVVHAEAGEAALPIGCRHYPRVLRIESAGIALSLSHYCPTAAALLVSDAPIRVLEATPPLALNEPVEGLDARGALPPLLRPDVLMDLEGYAAWEMAAIHLFSTCTRADVALARIASATDDLRGWKPGSAALVATVNNAFARASSAVPPWAAQGFPLARRLNRGIVSLDDPPTNRETLTTDAIERVLSNYLAARVYGNWIAYQGRGLRTIVAWLFACHDIVRLLMRRGPADGVAGALEAVRHADYVMLHTIDTQDFAGAAREVEG